MEPAGVPRGSPPGLAGSLLPLPYPRHRWLGWLGRWLVLAVTPVTARALLVVRGPAGRADHDAIMGGCAGCPRSGSPARPGAADGLMDTSALGGVGAAHPAAPFGGPLLLVQAAPSAVLFWPGNGISEAFRAHWACGANHLRLAFPHLTLGLTLSVRPEEEHDVLASARGGILPGPARPWRHGHLPTYLRHETVSSNFRVFFSPETPCWTDTRSHVFRHSPRLPIQRTTPPSCSRTYGSRAALRGPGVPGAIKAPDGRGPLRACRPDEAGRFSRTDTQLCHPL